MLIFFQVWPFCVVIISLIHKLSPWLLALTLYLGTSIHINLQFFKSWTVIISATFKSILSQSRCSLEPKIFLRDSEWPQTPQLHWWSLCLLFCWICLLLGSCLSCLVLFPGGFSDICPGYNKWHETNLVIWEK